MSIVVILPFYFVLFVARASRLAFSFSSCTILNSIWFNKFLSDPNIPNDNLLFAV